MRRSTEDHVVDFVVNLLLIFTVIVTLYPVYYVLIQSLSGPDEVVKGGIYFFPRGFTLRNYQNFFKDNKWFMAFVISVLRTVSGTVLVVFFTCLFAYALSFKNLLFRKGYISLLIFSMYFSGGIVPMYVLYKYLGLLNSFFVYIIPGVVSSFFVIVAISFFQSIPIELTESARIDGAHDLNIFLKIILPVSTPILATIGLFSAVGHWNSWIDSAFFIQKPELRTMTYLMIEVINRASVAKHSLESASRQSDAVQTTLSVQMTAMIISIVPIMCVYPFLQKYFVKGIMIGSVKG